MRRVGLFALVVGTACRTTHKQQMTSVDQSTMIVITVLAPSRLSSTWFDQGYEAAHSALEDCPTGCG